MLRLDLTTPNRCQKGDIRIWLDEVLIKNDFLIHKNHDIIQVCSKWGVGFFQYLFNIFDGGVIINFQINFSSASFFLQMVV